MHVFNNRRIKKWSVRRPLTSKGSGDVSSTNRMSLTCLGYFSLVDHSISLIIKQAQTIANPLHAIELKLLIETRLQDLAKLKELTLSERASDDTLEEIMRLETALHQALARCHLFMENREMYGKFVIHKHMLRFNETIVERWSRRITRLSYFAIPVLLGILAFRGLRTIGPHIRSLDL
ncbi:uncharacterized protein LOC111250217 isoform X2 [Varroa destructor]|uniref:Uncharacterized protein n=2 Tax=Varroa destructor TaxID=109461 RepID=A0A7M7KGV7_VARDE|nr:uncharacterized protein LOC111250217 isoform X2 [Varroa destructor]